MRVDSFYSQCQLDNPNDTSTSHRHRSLEAGDEYKESSAVGGMPDNTAITWAPETKQSPTGEEAESPMKTPVAREADGYFESEDNHGTGSPIAHTNDGWPGRSTASSGSLKAMSAYPTGGETVRRALSARSSFNQMRGRRHSKSQSTSAPRSKPNPDHPVYPDQSFASLSRPHPLRTRSSHPAQGMLYNDVKPRSPLQGAMTADNTPMSSPALFELPRSASAQAEEEERLHHLQTPKETHTVDIEHDVFTGNKMINNYEVVNELGRGEHGKVKLARNIENSHNVAVKIVPRYSRQRRLGRLGAPEDRTKKEVAILKKARHPNVVSLLEVIDDPNKNKVYLILEYVERGEILWRKKGVHDIVRIMNERYAEEKAGNHVAVETTEKERYDVELAKRRHEYNEKMHQRMPGPRDWSLEHSGDADSDLSRSASRQDLPSRTQSQDDVGDDLAGSMYGAYFTDAYRDRKFSIALSGISHLSSEITFGDDEENYVPALTMDEARRGFRDTLLGLEFLHYIGIIHRDIKPANLLVAKDGAVKISDFGVSYLGRPVAEEDPDNRLGEKDVSQLDDERELARSVGTPAFWAPEVCFEDVEMFEDGKPPKITGALDLWALGITLYCMIYARLPFYVGATRGLTESICYEEVFIPRTRLVPVDTTTPDKPTMHPPSTINSNKRLDFELKFEEVPEHVRDLIKKLLVKDPANRMTIMEAKQHPWVLDGESDPTKFVSGPSLADQPKETILSPNEKELDHAVVKRSIMERGVAMIGKVGNLAGSLLSRAGTLSRDGRKRAESTTSNSSESLPSPAGSASTVVKESRRKSAKVEDIANSLKASREHGHPLAQSEASSPQQEGDGYFEERRPRAPDRTVSHADSIRTLKGPAIEVQTDQPDSGLLHTMENIVEGAWGRLTSRTRHWTDRSASSSRQGSETDIHGAASVAMSTASATGSIEQPQMLREPPALSRDATVFPEDIMHSTGSDTKTEIHVPTDDNIALQPRPYPPLEPLSPDRAAFQPPASTDEAFEQAQEINTRKLILETQAAAQREADLANPRQVSSDECPPSPDDETYLQQAQPSASTISSAADDISLSMSNPSFGVASNASSPPTEGFLATVKMTDDAMKTSDTITERSVARGRALEERYEEDEESDDDGIMMGGR